MLLTHWKKCDDDEYSSYDSTVKDITSGMITKELSVEAQAFRTNPNARDLKGWTCVAIAVFHNSKSVLWLLLDHGGDPTIRSSYHKNALDIAKDELDAAGNIVVSKLEIRQVFEDWDKTNNSKKSLFGGNNGIERVDKGGDDDAEDGIDRSLEQMTEHFDEDKPGGKKSKNPKKKVGKSTSGAVKKAVTASVKAK